MAAVSMVQARGAAQPPVDEVSVRRLLSALEDMRDGKFRRRLPETGDGVLLELARTYNEVAERNAGWPPSCAGSGVRQAATAA